MLAIRFLRTGKKSQPFFRIVVTDKKNSPRGGEFVENVGFYNPLTKERSIKADRIKYWLSVGAQLSDTVNNLLISEKIIEGKKIAVHSISKKKLEEIKKATASKAEVVIEEVKSDESAEIPKEVIKEEISIEENKSIENSNEKSDNIEEEKKEEN